MKVLTRQIAMLKYVGATHPRNICGYELRLGVVPRQSWDSSGIRSKSQPRMRNDVVVKMSTIPDAVRTAHQFRYSTLGVEIAELPHRIPSDAQAIRLALLGSSNRVPLGVQQVTVTLLPTCERNRTGAVDPRNFKLKGDPAPALHHSNLAARAFEILRKPKHGNASQTPDSLEAAVSIHPTDCQIMRAHRLHT